MQKRRPQTLNGRVRGDSLGRATFHGTNGTSVIDYAICDQDLFSTITNFMVEKPSPVSDHSPILTWFYVNTEMSFSHIESPCVNDSLTHLPN